MQNLLNPKWLLAINTAPIIVLFLIFFGEYQIINSLLNEDITALWKMFGSALVGLATLNFLYIIFLNIKKRQVSPYYGILALITYIPLLYWYGMYSSEMIPFSIPRWMVTNNIELYAGTFLMPTLIYSLFILVIHFTSKEKVQKAWLNFLIAIAIPVSWYIFIQIILPFWKPVNSNFGSHFFVIFAIITTVVFLFFLIRAIYILGLKQTGRLQKYQLAWKIPVAIIFPLLGLALNNGHLLSDSWFGGLGIFGDFSNHWFYILAAINGIFICLPNKENKNYRLLLFIGRSLTFSYIFYFFLVFLPFLPLSVFAIIAVGTGFLMLTPLALFVIQAKELTNDYQYLKKNFASKSLIFASVISFLIIPLFITASYLKDKSVLNETLAYLYTPDYSKKYDIDELSLQKTFAVINQHKEKNRRTSSHIPYLSAYFNWLVLDNMTLSDAKLRKIEQIFFGQTSFDLGRPENIQNKDVEISKITSTSEFDKKQNAWISWIDIEITNNNSNNWFSEYATTITLPTGTWISDYYLYVGDKKEMGILSEKKSAMWIYSQIRNENRDPGILYYLTGNKVAFRVFPFAQDETRKTGIEFIHKEAITLTIDDHTLHLGNGFDKNDLERKNILPPVDLNQNVIYVSAKEKTTLSKVYRKPFYHFLVNTSKGKNKLKQQFIERIDQLLNKNILDQENAKISFVNTYTSTVLASDNWQEKYNEQNFNGGFYLDRAIKTSLSNSHKNLGNSYPVIVIVTDNMSDAIFKKDFSDFKMTFPESDLFYNLNKAGELQPHSLTSNPIIPLSESVVLSFDHSVLAFPEEKSAVAYLPNNSEASIVMANTIFKISDNKISDNKILDKNWQSGLIMQAQWISQVLHPETSNKEWLNLVRNSFISKIMTPVTAYLVVENEAQKAMLKKKQEQVLSSNQSLDLGDDVQRMSEPSLIIMILLIGLGLWFRQRKQGID